MPLFFEISEVATNKAHTGKHNAESPEFAEKRE
jgi:hypothetical protein